MVAECCKLYSTAAKDVTWLDHCSSELFEIPTQSIQNVMEGRAEWKWAPERWDVPEASRKHSATGLLSDVGV